MTDSAECTRLGRHWLISAEVGSYGLAGQAAILTAQRVLTSSLGTSILSGQAAGLRAARVTGAGRGTYTLSGPRVGGEARGNEVYAIVAQSVGAEKVTQKEE